MGALSSNDLETIPSNIGKYGALDTLLAVTKVMCDLREGLGRELSVNFDDDEAIMYFELDCKKIDLVLKIEAWSRERRFKYTVTRGQINRCHDQAGKVAIIGAFFSDPDLDAAFFLSFKEINNLKEKYQLFGNRLLKKYGNTSKSKLATAVFAVAGCLVVAGLVVSHFIPFFNWAIAPADYALVALAAGLFSSLASVTLSNDEFQRADAYLKENVETRLKNHRTAVQNVREEHGKRHR
jgi:hypothetical protein